MRLDYFFSVASAFIKAEIFKINVPLAIGWDLTFRCNRRCIYCKMWQVQCEELGTREVLEMVNKFKGLGTRWISYTGGEPLLRDDIGEIIRYTKNKSIYVSVSSNGDLVLEKIDDLKEIDKMQLSLDGLESVHDYIRGNGSFSRTLRAMELCQKNSIPVALACTLSKYNLDSINSLLKIASDYKVKVSFQPGTENLQWSKEINPNRPLREKYRITINKLIKLKKEGAPVYNSLAGLRHLYHWPVPRKIHCSAGKLNCFVEPDGTILSCGKILHEVSGVKRELVDFKKEISKTFFARNCMRCWAGKIVEFNLLCSFNFSAVSNYLINELQLKKQ